MEKKVWLIGIFSKTSISSDDKYEIKRVYGTEYQVKKHLMDLLKEDKKNIGNKEYKWSYGTEYKWMRGTKTMNEIEVDEGHGTFYAHADYSSAEFFFIHIYYTAKPEDAAEIATLK